MRSCLHIFMIVALFFSSSLTLAQNEPSSTSHVELARKDDGSWELLRDGKPYFIKGAGVNMGMEDLAAAGANSIRTWKASHIIHTLDKAQELGLSVTIGLWMGQERHGFDYSDKEVVQRQFDKAKRHVNQHKEHPALILWAVGNEAEWIKGTNIAIYRAINEVAKMIKQEDPHHPTMTVLAELGEHDVKIDFLKKYCPDIDILGVNSFAGLHSLPARLKAKGWNKPYVITEFGTIGPWEAQHTPWGSELEPTSTEKAKMYFENYVKGIYRQRHWCLGGYAFFWGQKFEVTPTWFSMLLRNGARLGSAEMMSAAWSRKWPENKCPTIEPIESRLAASVVRKGGQFEATVKAIDPEGDPLTYRWELMSEKKSITKHSVSTTSLKLIPKSFAEENGNRVLVTVPSHAGTFRLFVYVEDDHGNAATANTPFKTQ